MSETGSFSNGPFSSGYFKNVFYEKAVGEASHNFENK